MGDSDDSNERQLTKREIEEAENEYLIELVKNRPILYDVSSHTNKNRVGKESAWEGIGTEMKKTGN